MNKICIQEKKNNENYNSNCYNNMEKKNEYDKNVEKYNKNNNNDKAKNNEKGNNNDEKNKNQNNINNIKEDNDKEDKIDDETKKLFGEIIEIGNFLKTVVNCPYPNRPRNFTRYLPFNLFL